MTINVNGSVINIKDKLQQLERKRVSTQAEKSESADNKVSSKNDENNLISIIQVKNENRLAANSNGINSTEDAYKVLDELRNTFYNDLDSALNVHVKTDPNKVMRYYPFE